MIENTIKEHMEELLTLTNKQSIKKEKVIEKVYKAIEDMDLNPNKEKPSSLKAKTELIKVFNELIKEHETSLRENIKLEQKQLDLGLKENNNNLIEGILMKLNDKEVIDKIKKSNIGTTPMEMVDKELEDIIKEKNIEVTEGELKTDPKDIDLDKIKELIK